MSSPKYTLGCGVATFAQGVPSEQARQRRLREGRGLADEDGGGGVYKGKRRKRIPPLATAATVSSIDIVVSRDRCRSARAFFTASGFFFKRASCVARCSSSAESADRMPPPMTVSVARARSSTLAR